MNTTVTVAAIRSREDYRASLKRLGALLESDPAPGSEAGDEAQALSALIGAYEAKEFPVEPLDPVDFIVEAMDQQGVTRADLVDALGSKSKVSEVLSRKRPLSLQMIRNLHAQFHWPTDVLLGASELASTESHDSGQQRERASPELLKAMFENGYFEGMGASARGLAKKGDELLARFFGDDGVREPEAAYARSSVHHRTSKVMDPLAFSVWQTQVLRNARKQELKVGFDPEAWTPAVVEQLCRLSMETEGPRRAVDLFKRNGIAVVLERHLPKTYLDGAALRMADGRPVIALTLRHDRMDNFWYTLLHELGHVLRHLSAERPVLSDDLDAKNGALDPIEREADEFASSALVPEECAKRLKFASGKSDLVEEAARCARGLEVVAGRAWHETQDPTRFRRFVGDGKVRAMFGMDKRR